jgi:Skp family chaperone for outer membrane proteins
MEVKLIHPSDPEKKVVTVSDELQLAAFRSHGFVDLDVQKDLEAAKAEEAKTVADLEAELEATKKELADTKKALKKAKAEKAPKPGKKPAVDSKESESEGNE